MGKTLRESNPRRFRSLPYGTSVHDIADRCRRGVVEFVSGTAAGWSPVDLELWLGAPYRAASGSFAAPQGARPALALVRANGGFETSMMEAAEAVREMLTSCANPRMPAFVQDSVDRGFVIGAQGSDGALGHVPVDDPSMSLVDRVASLLAADFLTRPNDYRRVSLCEDCGAVSFEWTACDHQACAEARESGVVRRDDGAPVSYVAIFPPAEL